jgi:hypothetical protein
MNRLAKTSWWMPFHKHVPSCFKCLWNGIHQLVFASLFMHPLGSPSSSFSAHQTGLQWPQDAVEMPE